MTQNPYSASNDRQCIRKQHWNRRDTIGAALLAIPICGIVFAVLYPKNKFSSKQSNAPGDIQTTPSKDVRNDLPPFGRPGQEKGPVRNGT